jgi:hypothetical protein
MRCKRFTQNPVGTPHFDSAVLQLAEETPVHEEVQEAEAEPMDLDLNLADADDEQEPQALQDEQDCEPALAEEIDTDRAQLLVDVEEVDVLQGGVGALAASARAQFEVLRVACNTRAYMVGRKIGLAIEMGFFCAICLRRNAHMSHESAHVRRDAKTDVNAGKVTKTPEGFIRAASLLAYTTSDAVSEMQRAPYVPLCGSCHTLYDSYGQQAEIEFDARKQG